MNGAPPGLTRRRRLARAALWWERAWPALWPALCLAGAGLLVALLDLPRLLSPSAHAVLLALFAIGMVALLWRGARRLSLPAAAEADRRLERRSGLAHRPLAALVDKPAAATAEQMALWRAHVARAASQLRRLRVGWPSPGLAARDLRAVRGALVVALVAAFGIAGSDAPHRLLRAVTPGFAAAPLPAPPRVEAWITPPSYTGLAPLFLDPAGGSVSVPAGSRLSLSLTGGTGGEPVLALDDQTQPMRMLDAASFAAERDLAQGGRLAVLRDGQPLAAWDIAVVADAPPTAAFPEPPGRAGRGPMARLPWQATDDWGLAGLRAELRLRDRPDAPPLVIELPLPGGAPKTARGAHQTDLTAHPWAGLPTTARLIARDGAGQEGRSADVGFDLPEREFNHPVAKALIAIRKRLSVAPGERRWAQGELDRLSTDPGAFDNDAGVFLGIRTARHRLLRDRRPEAIEDVQALMWDLAIRLEEGATERTARALAEARQALREALERQERGEQVSREEIDRLMRELREAIDRHMQALAEEARREQAETAEPRDMQRLDRQEIERRADQLREAMRENRTEDARRELAELERMLEQLQAGRPERGQSRERNAQQRQRGQQQMGALQDMVQRQGKLLDNSHQRAGEAVEPRRPGQPPQQQQRNRPQSRQQQQQQQPGTPQQESEQRGLDRRQQDALRRALGELMQQFGDLTGDIPAPLSEADQAMREAGRALGEGRDGEARGAQQRAIEALQEGGREMSRQMARQFGPMGEESGEEGEGDQDGQGNAETGQDRNGRDSARRGEEGRDPLGRRTREGPAGSDEGSDVAVPDEAEASRTRAIQEELRRRGGDRSRPQPELDYIDRLLRRF